MKSDAIIHKFIEQGNLNPDFILWGSQDHLLLGYVSQYLLPHLVGCKSLYFV